MAKQALTTKELKTLCSKQGGIYTQLSGNKYIDALRKVVNIVNKNDQPFTINDIKKQPTLDMYKFAGKRDFKYVCDLHLNPLTFDENIASKIHPDGRKNEKIEAINFKDAKAKAVFSDSLGVAYIITCVIDDNEHIIKFGQTRKTFKDRLGSYNCGAVCHWRTASTTNLQIMQSMVTVRKDFKLYIYDCSDELYSITWHGVKSDTFASPKSLAVEDIMVKQFIKQFKQNPLAMTQVDAGTGKIKEED